MAVGDSFDVDLGGGAGEDMGHGTILECVKPQRLAYRWHWQTEDPSEVSVDLQDRGEQTLLRLTHSQIVPRNVIGYSGGWERVLLGLDDELTGTETYKPLIGAHEETAHKIWRELIG